MQRRGTESQAKETASAKAQRQLRLQCLREVKDTCVVGTQRGNQELITKRNNVGEKFGWPIRRDVVGKTNIWISLIFNFLKDLFI